MRGGWGRGRECRKGLGNGEGGVDTKQTRGSSLPTERTRDCQLPLHFEGRRKTTINIEKNTRTKTLKKGKTKHGRMVLGLLVASLPCAFCFLLISFYFGRLNHIRRSIDRVESMRTALFKQFTYGAAPILLMLDPCGGSESFISGNRRHTCIMKS